MDPENVLVENHLNFEKLFFDYTDSKSAQKITKSN